MFFKPMKERFIGRGRRPEEESHAANRQIVQSLQISNTYAVTVIFCLKRRRQHAHPHALEIQVILLQLSIFTLRGQAGKTPAAFRCQTNAGRRQRGFDNDTEMDEAIDDDGGTFRVRLCRHRHN
ncbi:hypothetical protein [Sinorhizobium meliloti]|uniref:hypothetical protein n=1 Tax=Rhizobium meliloti TaxID=382 RepID=UPI0018AD5B89|nr:hypothetical protein [Sinorhizobium meliloti]